jgi:glycosyltransferase involved in cell wall biosynthesis
MSMRNAIFYLTYNGLYNFTNGIGTQTQLLIGGFEMLREMLIRRYGPIDLHVVCPAPDTHTWGYDHAFFQRQQERLTKLDGYAHLIPYKQELTQDLWEIRSWKALCQNVAPLLHTLTAAYERSLIICVDQPWLQTPYSLEMCQSLEGQIDMLLVFYSTAFIRGGQTPVAAEVAWEQEALEASRPGSRVAIADVCPSSASHLKTHFRVPVGQFAPYTSSILAESSAFVSQDDAVVRATLDAYAIPLDAQLVLAFGRATPIKGFERLISALAPLRDRVHFVLISVPYINDDSQQQVYDQLLQRHAIRATHIKEFTRDLPRALCQWPRTKVVVVPSRHETFSNIPLEVALWARDKGPVIVASATDGFIDQIVPGLTGFLVDISSSRQLTETIAQVLDLSSEAHALIRHRAHQRVLQKYNFMQNFPATLDWFWQRRAGDRASTGAGD